MKRTVKFRGVDVSYSSPHDLVRKLNITMGQANELIRGNTNRIIVKNNEIQRINVKNNNAQLLSNLPYNIRRINNKILLSSDSFVQRGAIRIAKSIKPDEFVNVRIDVTFKFQDPSSGIWVDRRLGFYNYFGPPSNIMNDIYIRINDYINDIYDLPMEEMMANIASYVIRPEIFSTIKLDQKFDLLDDKLFDETPLDISNDWKNVQLNNNLNCAEVYLLKVLHPMFHNEIRHIGGGFGLSSNQIIKFANGNNMSIQIYDINGEINYKNIKEGSRSKKLIFMAYNSHLYPIKGKTLKKRINKYEIKIVENLTDQLIEFLDKNIKPGNIVFNGSLKSFTVDKIRYIDNQYYNKYSKILTSMGLQNQISDGVCVRNMFDKIGTLFLKENVDSFWPEHNRFIKSDFNYKISNIDQTRKISKIDLSKAYPFSLYSLPYLIKFDYRTNKINTNVTEIIDHYIYNVKPKQYSLLLPSQDLYPGYHLIHAKTEGLEFEILEEIETEKVYNYYSNMIIEMYNNLSIDDFKQICVIGIGKMQINSDYHQKYIFKGIHKTNTKCIDGIAEKLNDKYSLVYDNDIVPVCPYTKRIIAIQVKDMCRKLVYDKMKELKLKDEDIIQIKVDSITYYGDLPKKLSTNIGCWKKESIDFSLFTNALDFGIDNIPKPLGDELISNSIDIPIISINPKTKNNNTLYNCFAGSGKTHTVINKIIPQMKDYIVLSPTHYALHEYRALNLNCDVIHKYIYQNIIPKEQNIIIDEYGMLDKDGNDLIYKCLLLDKCIYALGDFNQLPPVKGDKKSKFNSSHYLNYMFKNQNKLDINHRNFFPISYYNHLINGTYDYELEIAKWNHINPYEAKMIICWTNNECDFWNYAYMKYHNIEFGPNMKILCKTNLLRNKSIYKNFEYVIKSIDNDIITLDNNETITMKQYNNYFKPAYAKTLYAVQGQSIESFYFPQSEIMYLDNQSVYTLISRLTF